MVVALRPFATTVVASATEGLRPRCHTTAAPPDTYRQARLTRKVRVTAYQLHNGQHGSHHLGR
jgi:hypothetical protein